MEHIDLHCMLSLESEVCHRFQLTGDACGDSFSFNSGRGGGKGQENKEEEVDNHPLASARFLEILIFLVEPL